MGILKKVFKAAGYGGDYVCKRCGQKKTMASTAVCKGSTRKHKWVRA